MYNIVLFFLKSFQKEPVFVRKSVGLHLIFVHKSVIYEKGSF